MKKLREKLPLTVFLDFEQICSARTGGQDGWTWDRGDNIPLEIGIVKFFSTSMCQRYDSVQLHLREKEEWLCRRMREKEDWLCRRMREKEEWL